MSKLSITRGKLGEIKAVKYLEKNKYKILATNFKALRFGEIDIIAAIDEFIVFVEVKTRSENAVAEPAEFVTKQKQRKIIKSAEFYMLVNKINKQPRFDIIELFIKFGKLEDLNHIENAFTP